MPTLDLWGAITLSATAVATIAVLAVWYGREQGGLRRVLIHSAWLVAVVVITGTGLLDVLGTPGLGIMVAVPLILAIVAAIRSPRFAAAIQSIPTTALIAISALRVEGVYFVLLFADHRLPAPFAPAAGWGDMITGALALPVAWAWYRRIPGATALLLLWNLFGFADLVDAIGLGVTSAEGSPVRIFFGDPSSAAMTTLPWILIPGFIVPNLLLTHLAIFRRVLGGSRSTHAVAN
ncbi:MAG TPA: hypothetical protein VGG27_15095 [Magnetospirillaceae bacterium]